MENLYGVMELLTKGTSKRDCFMAKEPLRIHLSITHTKESILKTIVMGTAKRKSLGSFMQANFIKESDVEWEN